jgi:hypothetical protein
VRHGRKAHPQSTPARAFDVAAAGTLVHPPRAGAHVLHTMPSSCQVNRVFVVFIALLGSPVLASAAEAVAPATRSCDKERGAVLKGAQALATASQKSDSKAIVKLSHQSLLDIVGGPERLLEMTDKGFSDLAARGLKLERAKLGKPTTTHAAGARSVCFLPREMTYNIAGKRTTRVGFFIAVHDGAAKDSWKYLDGDAVAKTPELLQQLLPGLPEKIELPPTRVEKLQ